MAEVAIVLVLSRSPLGHPLSLSSFNFPFLSSDPFLSLYNCQDENVSGPLYFGDTSIINIRTLSMDHSDLHLLCPIVIMLEWYCLSNFVTFTTRIVYQRFFLFYCVESVQMFLNSWGCPEVSNYVQTETSKKKHKHFTQILFGLLLKVMKENLPNIF